MACPRRLTAAVLAGTVIIAFPSAAARPSVKRRTAVAAHFLVTKQEPDGSVPALSAIGSTGDAVLAWVAARRAPRAIDDALDFLAANEAEVDSLGEVAKVALAWIAGGRDPRDFANRDLVLEIETSQELDGRYDATSSVFSHAMAMLALVGAGGSATIPAAAEWLINAQCDNGGWQFLEPASGAEDENCALGPLDIDTANSDTTSLAIQAIESLPVPLPYENDPFAYLLAERDEIKGGWGYDRTFAITNANSTGMVLQAFGAADLEPPRGSQRALRRLQAPLCGSTGGSFYYSWEDEDGDGTYQRTGRDNAAATMAAIPGLLMMQSLMPDREVTSAPPEPKPC
jgi:hypothetical protein